jgi:hypothetical protein
MAQFFFDKADGQATADNAHIYFLCSLAAGGAQAQLPAHWSDWARGGLGGFVIKTGTGVLQKIYINTTSIDTSNINAYPLTSPISLEEGDNGFKFWGYTSDGAPIIATKDPSTCDPSEFGDYF